MIRKMLRKIKTVFWSVIAVSLGMLQIGEFDLAAYKDCWTNSELLYECFELGKKYGPVNSKEEALELLKKHKPELFK